MDRANSAWWKNSWPLALLVTLGLTLALFYPIHSFDFSIIDDDANIFNNIYLHDPSTQKIGYFWTHPYYELYMPVTSTIWALLVRVATGSVARPAPPGGAAVTMLDPGIFHIASLLLHLAVTGLVFLILRRFGFKSWASAGGALLFAIHPLQIQAVAWITGMNNLTSAFFGLLAVYVYFQQAGIPSESAAVLDTPHKNRAIYLTLSSVLFLVALLSKPTTVVIPFFLIIFEVLIWRRPARQWAPLVSVWILFSAICGFVTRSASADATAYVWSPLWGRPFVVGDSLSFYIWKIIYPVNLTFDYTRSPHSVLTSWWGYVTWIVPVALAVILVFDLGKKNLQETAGAASHTTRRWTVVAILVFLVALLPTLGIVASYSQVVSTVFDRYVYLAMLGPAIWVAYVLSMPGKRFGMQIACVILVFLYFAYETVVQLPVWRNMDVQTNQMLEANPQSAIGHHDKGLILGARDDVPGALREFEKEVRLQNGTNARADFYYGVTLVESGRYEEAAKPLRVAFDGARNDGEYWYQLWNVLALLNRLPEAENVVRQHIKVSPEDGRAQFTLAKMLVTRGDSAEALPYLAVARVKLPQEPAVSFFTGLAYEKLGQLPEAIAAYRVALRRDPGRKEIEDALTRLHASSK